MKKWGSDLNLSQRMQLKAFICFLGILLLLILLVVRAMIAFLLKEPEPILRNLTNVWVMEVGEDSLRIFEDGVENVYPLMEGVQIPGEAREQVADILLSDEKVAQITCKTNKINGKVLSVDDTGVEIEGFGRLALSQEVRGYRLYKTLSMCSIQDIMIGYDFTDFVVENGEICGILMVKEGAMEYIRVLLKTTDYSGLLHDEIVLSCDTDYVIQYGSFEQQLEEIHLAGDVCTIDMQSKYFTGERITIIPSALTGKVSLHNVSRSQEIPGYRGTLELVKTKEGIAVINEVLLEEYLYSVVPSEMPASYPKEALKAQAVCARTYAFRHMLHAGYPEYGAHVDDSTGYQVYNNILEQEASTKAVKETYGQVLYPKDSDLPADTYYYSTSCGIGSNADVWRVEAGNSPSYLSPVRVNRSVLQNTSGMSDYLLEAQALMTEENFAEFICTKNAEDYEVTEGWYRWSYSVEELNGEIIRERLMQRFKANPAQILTYNRDGVFESRKIGEWECINEIAVSKRGLGGVAQELLIVTDQDTYKVITEYSIRYVLCDGITMVHRQDGSQVAAPNLLPSGFFIIDVSKEKENAVSYSLTGGGYGHGVGMSQNGARNMAAEGVTASEILSFFYRDCSVKNIYGQ